jgi:hypothetical protein
MKLALIIGLATTLCVNASYAETIANCGNLEGHAYYQQQGSITEKNSGWKPDKISDGNIALQKLKEGYDIVYVDSTNNMSSTLQDDKAKITLLNRTDEELTFLVHLPSGGSDIYRFFKQSDGSNKIALISARTQLPKSSLMIGNCDYINIPK